jgi:hypothetical protein
VLDHPAHLAIQRSRAYLTANVVGPESLCELQARHNDRLTVAQRDAAGSFRATVVQDPGLGLRQRSHPHPSRRQPLGAPRVTPYHCGTFLGLPRGHRCITPSHGLAGPKHGGQEVLAA